MSFVSRPILSVLRPQTHFFYLKSTSEKKKKGVHKNGLYCYLHIYNEKYKKKKRSCTFVPPLRRTRPTNKAKDNVHMKKKTSPPSLNMHHSLYYPTYSLFHIFLTSLPSNPDICFPPFITAHKKNKNKSIFLHNLNFLRNHFPAPHTCVCAGDCSWHFKLRFM